MIIKLIKFKKPLIHIIVSAWFHYSNNFYELSVNKGNNFLPFISFFKLTTTSLTSVIMFKYSYGAYFQ